MATTTPREVRWERMFPDELEAAFAARPVVYFAYGLCEPHGPQNAVGLDALKAHRIAVETARAHGGIVAPPDYWHIHELGGYALWAARNVGEVQRKWLTAVPPWVHFKNVCYQIRAAEVIGFQAALLITGHYGPNWKDLKRIVELIQPYVRVRLHALPDFEANVPGFDSDGASGGDHAGRVETSLLWALEPDSVDLSRIPESAPAQPKTAGPTPPRSGRDASAKPPYFAMGANVGQSNRLTGERMVADEVRWLGAKADELLATYDTTSTAAGLPTFDAVEAFWDQEVRPRIDELKTMQRTFGDDATVSEGSVWHANWQIPERS